MLFGVCCCNTRHMTYDAYEPSTQKYFQNLLLATTQFVKEQSTILVV
jgi:hypothetical protein